MSARTTDHVADVQPFSNGSEAEYWLGANCHRCARDGYRLDSAACPMEEAIARGFVLGTVPATLATEYGATVRGEYCDLPRQCPRFALSDRCEYLLWPATRRQRPCGAVATTEHTARGLRWAVCAKHARRVALAGGAR